MNYSKSLILFAAAVLACACTKAGSGSDFSGGAAAKVSIESLAGSAATKTVLTGNSLSWEESDC